MPYPSFSSEILATPTKSSAPRASSPAEPTRLPIWTCVEPALEPIGAFFHTGRVRSAAADCTRPSSAEPCIPADVAARNWVALSEFCRDLLAIPSSTAFDEDPPTPAGPSVSVPSHPDDITTGASVSSVVLPHPEPSRSVVWKKCPGDLFSKALTVDIVSADAIAAPSDGRAALYLAALERVEERVVLEYSGVPEENGWKFKHVQKGVQVHTKLCENGVLISRGAMNFIVDIYCLFYISLPLMLSACIIPGVDI
jgi:hypothetical protein